MADMNSTKSLTCSTRIGPPGNVHAQLGQPSSRTIGEMPLSASLLSLLSTPPQLYCAGEMLFGSISDQATPMRAAPMPAPTTPFSVPGEVSPLRSTEKREMVSRGAGG